MQTGNLAPNLFICAAPKCGTTTVHWMLKGFDDIATTSPKEPKYFLNTDNPALEPYIDKYLSGLNNESIRADCCPRNLFFPYALDAINSICPDAKFVVIARDPVKRLYSHWWHWFATGKTALSFREFFEHESTQVLEEHIPTAKDYRRLNAKGKVMLGTGYAVECGKFHKYLSSAISQYGRDRFLVLIFEEVIATPQLIADEIRQFVGLPILPIIGPVEHMNAAEVHGARPPLDSEDAKVVKDYYRDDTQRLANMMGRTLPWQSCN